MADKAKDLGIIVEFRFIENGDLLHRGTIERYHEKLYVKSEGIDELERLVLELAEQVKELGP